MFDSVSGITGSSTYTDATFEDQKFMVTTVPTNTTFTLTMAVQESGTPLSGSGSASVLCYYTVGPAQQAGGFGWGTGLWSGTVNGPVTNTLSANINDAVTVIPLTSTNGFPSTGTIRIGTEDISYTSINGNNLEGATREVDGTTKAAHNSGDTVTNITDYVGWGEASSDDFTIDPGLWVLDNYGTKLIALIYNAQCFE